MRRPALLLSTVLLGSGLVACGGPDVGSYCDAIEANRQALSLEDPSSFGPFRDAAQEVADASPEGVAADWRTIDEAFGTIEDAVEAQGLSFEELGTLQENPSAADAETLQSLEAAFAEVDDQLSGERFTSAGDSIETYTQENCDVDLGNL